MSRRVYEIIGLGIIQTAIVNVLFFNQCSFKPTVHRFLIVFYFLSALVVLARKKSVRCITVLLVPQLLSRRGRAALIGYVLVLTVTGPTENTMRNVEVLGKTLSCTQEQLKTAICDTMNALKIPFLTMKQIIDELLKTVERSFMKVQQTLMEVLKLAKRILFSIKAAYDWLRDVVSICNDKMGTPSDRCIKALDQTIEGCKEEMGSMDFLCEVTQIGKTICYGAKMVDLFCELVDFVSDNIVEEIELGVQELMKNMEELFRVKVEYEHSFDFVTNASKSFDEVSADIRKEIVERSLPLRRTFNMLTIVNSVFFICIVLRSIRYLDKYVRKDDFDNNFLTEDFYTIEERRLAMNIEAVFPLTRKESHRYVSLASFQLTWNERWRMAKSVTFLFVSSTQIGIQLFADYALYWLLTLIKCFMHEGSEHLKGSSGTRPLAVGVSGEGILADTLRDIVRSFDPVVNGTTIDPSRCITDASAPQFGRYGQILTLLAVCWIFTILEPYGLRVRQLIMRRYYPNRARARAQWLYRDILLKRESLVSLLRRQIGRTKRHNIGEKKIKWLDLIRAKTNRFWICRKLLGLGDTLRCTLCDEAMNEQQDECISCPRPGCAGLYCQDCFLETANSCSLCLGILLHETNMSDISLERLE